jgi:hypothetical protein
LPITHTVAVAGGGVVGVLVVVLTVVVVLVVAVVALVGGGLLDDVGLLDVVDLLVVADVLTTVGSVLLGAAPETVGEVAGWVDVVGVSGLVGIVLRVPLDEFVVAGEDDEAADDPGVDEAAVALGEPLVVP